MAGWLIIEGRADIRKAFQWFNPMVVLQPWRQPCWWTDEFYTCAMTKASIIDVLKNSYISLSLLVIDRWRRVLLSRLTHSGTGAHDDGKSNNDSNIDTGEQQAGQRTICSPSTTTPSPRPRYVQRLIPSGSSIADAEWHKG